MNHSIEILREAKAKKVGIIIIISLIVIPVVGTFMANRYHADKAPEILVQRYITSQSNGDKDTSLPLLTGEAKDIVSKNKYVSNPVIEMKTNTVTITNEFAEVSAFIKQKDDALNETFYLRKDYDNTWKIYAIELAKDSFSGLSNTTVEYGMKKTIEQYNQSIALGNVKEAMKELVGEAKIKASVIPVSSTKPVEKILATGIKSVGKLPNGEVLLSVRIDETTIGVNRTKELLYTMVLLDKDWKIYDIRKVDEKVN